MKFEDILARVKNPETKAALEKLDAEERKVFEQDFVLQAEAQTAAAELQKGKDELARLQSLEKQWDNFYAYSGAETVEQRRALEKQYRDRYSSYPEVERQLKEQSDKVKELEEKARETAVAAGSEGEEQVTEKKKETTAPPIDTSKFLTAEALDERLKKFGDEVFARTLNTVHTASIPAAIQVESLQRKAKEDLGIDLDINKLGEYSKQFNNIVSAYDYMTRELYFKKQHDADVKVAEDKATAEYQRGLTEGRSRTFSPEDSTSGDYQGNIAQIMRGDKGDNKVPEVPSDYQFDGSILAKAAYKEFRELEAQGKTM